ncbi:Fic family protein [Ralstonia insidiosa]|uniref:Uncharacterized protein n=1 Tax=Ralstonia insidiosa TaxID=190721 RepID=A0A191ZSA6_9RALS|nr:Fic family protein [Ralstonia insidiosa]ANJ70981.1 hypothetical protein A9Y76_00095 [Ralstonia insidiosa]KAB0471560.1 Fic family protein [Ralstonia insidiosa]MBY4908897.1 Fic family protein [Ralstonia insidiosa]
MLQRNMSPAGIKLAHRLDLPLAARGPATYQQDFVERYVPNHAWLLPQELAEELYALCGQGKTQPARSYGERAFPRLLIDLSWNSSRLDGNRYSRHAAEELLNGGAPRCDIDTVMLLNHRAAIEFLLDCVLREGLSTLVVQNLHALLMRDLVPDGARLGAIRNSQLGIAGTLYSPMRDAEQVERMLKSIVGKAALIKNPVEAAFFLWVNLAYLQPFDDGNNCTGRLVANIPLLLHGCAPLAFLGIDRDDYLQAMLGVYEYQDVALAVDLFLWTYRRSVSKYGMLKDI